MRTTSKKRTRTRAAFAVIASLSILAAACGSDDDSGSGSTDAPATDATTAEPAVTDAPVVTDAPTTETDAPTTETDADGTTAPTDSVDDGNSAGITWNMEQANDELTATVGEYPQAEGNTTQGIDGENIKLACVVAATTNGAPSFGDQYCEGAQARLDRANAAGDLPYKLNIETQTDTGGDAAKAVNDLTEAVFTDKVFAAFFSQAGAMPSNPLEDTHIPYFGDFAACGKNSVYGFNVTFQILQCAAVSAETEGKSITYTDSIQAAFSALLGKGITEFKYAAVGTSLPGIVTYQKNFVDQFKAQGINVVYSDNLLPPTSGEAVDMNPYVIPVIDAKPDIVGIFSTDPLLTARFFGAMKDAGYTGKASLQVLATMLQNPQTAQQLDGASGTNSSWGYDNGSDEWKVLEADAAAAGYEGPVQSGFYRGWGAADELVTGLTDFLKTGDELTTENLVNFMNNGWVWPGYGNVVAPTIYPYGKYGPSPCAAISKVSAAEKMELPDQDLTCGSVYFKDL